MSITLQPGQTQQFSAQPKDSFNNNLFGVGAPKWSVSDPAAGTINSVGLFTAAPLGSLSSLVTATVTATLQGVSGSSTVSVDGSELTFLRANIVGGDTAMLGLWSVRSGLSQSGGVTTQWTDARGGGFGPALTPTGSGGLSVVGSDPSTMYLRSDGGRQLTTGVSAVLDPSKVKAIVSINTTNAPVGAHFPFLLSNAGLTHLLAVDEENNGQEGHVLVTTETVLIQTRRVKGPKLRVYITGRDGATVHAMEPPSPDVTGTSTIPVSENGQLIIGYSADEHHRTYIALDHVPSTAETIAIEQWGRVYHGTTTGSPHAIILDGDSLAEGWTDPIATTVDATHGWFPQLMLLAPYADYDEANQGVSSSFFNSASPDATFNLITRGPTWIDPMHRATRTREVLLVLAGTNDIATNRTSAQILADAQIYVTARKAAGFADIRFCTVIPRNLSGPEETQRTTYNAALIAAAASMGIRVIDLTTHVAFNSSTSWTNLTYYNADGIHLTLAGYQAIRDVVNTDLQAA